MRAMIFVFVLVALAASAKELPFSLDSVDTQLSAIGAHAKNYPPRFSSPEERQKIESELRSAIAMLDAAVASDPDNPELLLRDGFANAMGHNLDFKGCAAKSVEVFERLLTLRPNDRQARLHYGAFLGGAGRPKDSIPHLLKAIELGASEANYSVAISYLMVEDKERAIPHLTTYVSAHPKDESAKKLLAALKSKNLKIERSSEEPPARSRNARTDGGQS